MAVLLILLEIQTFWEFELHNGVHFVGYICLAVCALLELFSCQQCRLETTQWAVCGNLVMLCLTVSNQSSCLIWQVLAVNKEPSMDTAISIWQQRKLRDQVPTFCCVHHLDPRLLKKYVIPPVLQGQALLKNLLVSSLSQLVRWMATKAEELGVEVYPGFAASEVPSFFILETLMWKD